MLAILQRLTSGTGDVWCGGPEGGGNVAVRDGRRADFKLRAPSSSKWCRHHVMEGSVGVALTRSDSRARVHSEKGNTGFIHRK